MATLVHELGLWWGLPLALGLGSIWFVWANAQTHDELFRVFFGHHNLDRAMGETVLGRRDHPWWLYGPLAFWDMLPWSLTLPLACWYLWRESGWSADPVARFGAAWFVAILFILSCVSFKRSDYLLPAYPGLALFLGCAAERWYLASGRRRAVAVGFGVTIAAGAAVWWGYLEFSLPKQDLGLEYRRFAIEVRRYAPKPESVLFFRTETHALAFHVGRPLDVFVEWERLGVWTDRPNGCWVVMPLAVFQECPDHLGPGRFDLVLTSTDLPGCQHKKPLVFLRSRSSSARPCESVHARAARTPTDCHGAVDCPAAGQ
jgi:hypothetical protein